MDKFDFFRIAVEKYLEKNGNEILNVKDLLFILNMVSDYSEKVNATEN